MKKILLALGILLITVNAHAAFQEGYPATGGAVSSAQLRANLDTLWQGTLKYFNPGTITGKSMAYTGGKATFGKNPYTVADGSADFTAYVNGQTVYVSLIESGAAAVLSKSTTGYNSQGIPLWKISVGASTVTLSSDARTWVQKGGTATVQETQTFDFEGLWAVMGSNPDKFTLQRQGTAVSIVYNAYYEGGAWAVRDSSKPQARIDFPAAGGVEVYSSPAGAGCSWGKVLTVSGDRIDCGSNRMLIVPSATTTQRDAMTEADGAVIYNSTTNKIETVNNGNWVNIGMPAGSITAYAGAVAPSGWLVCDGSAVSRSTYGELFTAIGTTYGTGDGSTTFNLPDLRGRTAIGAGQGVGLTNRALGAKAGEETHALSTAEVPAHNYASAMSAPGMTDGGGFYALTAAGLSGVGAAHNNMQPFIALTYIIRH